MDVEGRRREVGGLYGWRQICGQLDAQWVVGSGAELSGSRGLLGHDGGWQWIYPTPQLEYRRHLIYRPQSMRWH